MNEEINKVEFYSSKFPFKLWTYIEGFFFFFFF